PPLRTQQEKRITMQPQMKGFFRSLLSGAQMQGANLTDAQMQGAVFDGTDMQGALLVGADTRGASANLADCTAFLVSDLTVAPPLSREDLASLLEHFDLDSELIDHRLKQYNERGPLRCMDDHGRPLSERPLPSSRELGALWRNLSCANPAVARMLWNAYIPEATGLGPKIQAILSRPPRS
ncbi:pentapeptide repeat-containing protein, partial [Magnetospirillum sulfuroxidans]